MSLPKLLTKAHQNIYFAVEDIVAAYGKLAGYSLEDEGTEMILFDMIEPLRTIQTRLRRLARASERKEQCTP